MKKTVFTPFVKRMTKADTLFIHRVGNKYLITDSFVAMAVPEIVYREEFQPVSGAFIRLDDGQNARRNKGQALPQVDAGMDINRVFEPARSVTTEVTKTLFTIDLPKGKKTVQARVFVIDHKPLLIDTTIWECVEPFTDNGVVAKNPQSPAYAESHGVEVLAMPIRVPDEHKSKLEALASV